jgi:DNA-3-methyladenine glycosylase
VVVHGEAAGRIVETEAYHEIEPASHAFIGLTARSRILFERPGRAYVYRSYGIHALLNAVCEGEGVGAGVLIRALEPTSGLAGMRRRRGTDRLEDLCSGPGKLTQALGVELVENGGDLAVGAVRIARAPAGLTPLGPVVAGPRVGITKAVELPWRFAVAGSVYVSRPRPRVNG